MKQRKTVVIGFLGTKLDGGVTDKRWERWRPTVSLFAHEHFQPDVLELLHFGQPSALAEVVSADIAGLRPQAVVRTHNLPGEDYWDFAQVYAALHDFARQYEFEEDTDYYVHLSTGTHVAQICLFLLTEARYFPARLVETGSSMLLAPQERWRGKLEVIDLNLSAYDQLATRFHKESQDSQSLLKGGIVTRNAAFNALIGRIEQVALKSTAPLLLSGPTGAGKTALAQRIFALRSRRHLAKGALVEVNCATLRGDQAMSTLFGHKKGAFTGALSARTGLLKAADHGVLFLDEIGELGLDEQAMLLRALEDKRFMPMGSDTEVHSDFQLLAGTNQDLHAAVRAGRFRADLLARLSVWHFVLPGLAARPEDLEPNLDHELERSAIELGTRVTMTRPARELFLQEARRAAWPGNFRDFSAAVRRLATLSEAGRISDDLVREEAQAWPQAQDSESDAGMSGPGVGLSAQTRAAIEQLLPAEGLDLMEEVQLRTALQVIAQTNSMAEAGRRLFAQSRQVRQSVNDSDRVRKLLSRFGLEYREVKRVLQAG